jgi:hypothetical protein
MTWRKSTFSDPNNCVEVRGDLAAIRDTKRPEVIMAVSREALDRLTTWVVR